MVYTILQSLAVLAVLSNGLVFVVSGIPLNSERTLFSIALVPVVMAAFIVPGINITGATVMYAAFVATAVASAYASGDFLGHFNGLLITAMPFFYYWIFSQRKLSVDVTRRASGVVLGIVSGAALLVYAVWTVTGQLEWMIDRGRIKLLMMEPNIFGSTIAAVALIHMSVAQRGAGTVLVQLLGLAALILTASKAPYAAYLAGVAYLAYKKRVFRGGGALLAGTVGCALLVWAIVVFWPEIVSIYNAVLSRQDAINNRMFALQIGWSRFLENPFLGNGPLDFSYAGHSILQRMGTTNDRNLWIWQIWIAVLHDEGLLGFAAFVALLVASWLGASTRHKAGNPGYLGPLAALLALLLASQATTVHLTAIFGIVLGLLNARSMVVVQRGG